ncbi:MAG: hypothetical protein HFF49_06720 [Lawsonibacter sp.]|jgi:hypothetical protein|nr:hypothetical protein [Lawsonibacter sp.]
MKQHKDVPEKIVFQGTADQLEQAGDYLILLSYVRSVRRGRIMGPIVTIFLAMAVMIQFRSGNSALTWVYLILALYVGMTVMRKTMGGDPAASVKANRESRAAAAAAGKYDGNLPFRIELAEHQCRVYFGEGGQPSQIFDCRKFRSAVECDEIVWLTGKRGLGLPLPKEQLVDATPGQLRRWLRPYAAIWSMSHIPDKLKESLKE